NAIASAGSLVVSPLRHPSAEYAGWVENKGTVEQRVHHLTVFRPFPNARIADVPIRHGSEGPDPSRLTEATTPNALTQSLRCVGRPRSQQVHLVRTTQTQGKTSVVSGVHRLQPTQFKHQSESTRESLR